MSIVEDADIDMVSTQSYFRDENENENLNYCTSFNEYENENYYRRKNENEKSGQTIQQYYANLPLHSNANITWFLVLGLKIAVLFGGSAAGSVPH